MNAFSFDSTILGSNRNGQGSVDAVECAFTAKLRKLVASIARGLYRRLGIWLALNLKRMPAGMTPAAATCSCWHVDRDQRHQRWTSGVVVTRGTVGDC